MAVENNILVTLITKSTFVRRGVPQGRFIGLQIIRNMLVHLEPFFDH